MAQVAQSGTATRNTKGSLKNSRTRCWCFTLNNYSMEDIKAFEKCGGKYCFQEEMGESGTKHLQGVLQLPNGVSLNHMKKLNGRAHWEVCRNLNASIQYCSKSDTRIGNIYSNMKLKSGTNGTVDFELDKMQRLKEFMDTDEFKKWKMDTGYAWLQGKMEEEQS